jgi:ATP-binding cassette subfamily B (MDR/TAP) protein 1
MQQMFLRGFSGDIAKAQAGASMLAGEAVSNIRTVAAFNAEDKVLRLFRHELEIPMEKSFWRGQVPGRLIPSLIPFYQTCEQQQRD